MVKKLIVKTPTLELDPKYISKASEWDEFIGLWNNAQEAERQNQWFKGDIAKQVAIKFGERSLEEFAKEVNEARSSIENYRRVARAFLASKNERNYNVPFTTYLLASYADEYDKKHGKFRTRRRFKWTERAEANKWSVRRLAQEIKNAKQLKDGSSQFDLCLDYIIKFETMFVNLKTSKLNNEQWLKIIKKLEFLITQLKSKKLKT